MQALGDSPDWLAKRLFIPSSLAALVLGILLTIEGSWTFDTRLSLSRQSHSAPGA